MARRDTGDSHRHMQAVIPARAVRGAVSPAATTERDKPVAAGPRVELVREGGVVRAIDVICTCGERLRVVCEYEI